MLLMFNEFFICIFKKTVSSKKALFGLKKTVNVDLSKEKNRHRMANTSDKMCLLQEYFLSSKILTMCYLLKELLQSNSIDFFLSSKFLDNSLKPNVYENIGSILKDPVD